MEYLIALIVFIFIGIIYSMSEDAKRERHDKEVKEKRAANMRAINERRAAEKAQANELALLEEQKLERERQITEKRREAMRSLNQKRAEERARAKEIELQNEQNPELIAKKRSLIGNLIEEIKCRNISLFESNNLKDIDAEIQYAHKRFVDAGLGKKNQDKHYWGSYYFVLRHKKLKCIFNDIEGRTDNNKGRYVMLDVSLDCLINWITEYYALLRDEDVWIRTQWNSENTKFVRARNYFSGKLWKPALKLWDNFGDEGLEIKSYDSEEFIYLTLGRDGISVGCEDDITDEGAFFTVEQKWKLKPYLFCKIENYKISFAIEEIKNILNSNCSKINSSFVEPELWAQEVLLQSNGISIFKKSMVCNYSNGMLVVDYELPNLDVIPKVKKYKYVAKTGTITEQPNSNTFISATYENLLYSITIRSLYELAINDVNNQIQAITFNGFVSSVNPANGQMERKCILSIQTGKSAILEVNINMIDPKACFKSLKGVCAAKLIDMSPVTPVLTFNKKDKRFIEGRNVDVNQGTNLASMHWEDFEQLVRTIFEEEFAKNGGEVRVTQASRDGGVDAIVFDPDPLRGGKIVVQAKRYTNTVGVSAVRDLYGTIINEGANSGILITTSDYGTDSYEFAKDKPIKLLNGGHLLALLRRNGHQGYIDIQEAKKEMNAM